MADERSTSPQRLLAAVLLAPVTLGARFVDELPTNLSKARQQVELARFIGKMVVDQSAQEAKRRLAPDKPPPEPRGTDLPTPGPTEPDEVASVTSHVEAAILALPDFDQLPAAHIVGKLAGLTQAERDDIEVYEVAHRHRRTVLGKLDQLRVGGA